MNQILEDIKKTLDWFDIHAKSPNIADIAIVLTKVSIQSATLGELKSDAYDVLVDLEDDYKSSMAERVIKLIKDEGMGVAAAERQAEADLKEKRRDWKQADKVFSRLRGFLDRVDKICDTVRQRVAVERSFASKNI